MKGDDLSERFLDFAARIVKLVTAVPKNQAARHIAGQILRSGRSIGSNYEEARGAESRADFIHRLSISWKEARESWYWLRLMQRAQLIKPIRLAALTQEANEISAILGRSLATAKGKKRPPMRPDPPNQGPSFNS
jgi:four helix bundle protein